MNPLTRDPETGASRRGVPLFPPVDRALIQAAAFILLAAAAARADILTWGDCVREARDANPVLRQARYSLEAARAARRSSFSGFLPTVSASAGTSAGGSERPYFDGIDFAYDGYRAGIGASQSLFSGFSTVADTESALASVHRSEAALQQSEAGLRRRLRNAFVSLLYSQEYLEVQTEIARRRVGNGDLVRLRYDAGLENEGSALRAAADARQAQFDVARARRDLILAQQNLALELGRDEFAPIEVGGSWTVAPPPDSADIVALAAETPSVRQALADQDSAHASYRKSVAPFWPALSANASVNWDLTRDEQLDFRHWNWDEIDDSWSVSLSVSYRLFAGGDRWFAVKARKADVLRTRESLAAAKRDTRVTLQEKLFAYMDAHENISVQEQYLNASRVRAEVARVQYSNGLLGFTQWDIIEAELVQAERRQIAARRDALYAETAWTQALGRGFSQ